MFKQLASLFLVITLSVISAQSQGQVANLNNSSDPSILVSTKLYPNPVTDYISVSIELQQKATVQVDIFNMIGKNIQNLFDGTMQETSYNETFYLSSDLPEGIYFLKVTVNDKVAAVKRFSKK